MSKFKTKWFYASIGHYEEIKSKGWFSYKTYSKVKIPTPEAANYDEFSAELEKVYNEFDNEGYDVVNVVPLAIGASDERYGKLSNGSKNYVGDVGFSVTRGAIVIGKLRDSAG